MKIILDILRGLEAYRLYSEEKYSGEKDVAIRVCQAICANLGRLPKSRAEWSTIANLGELQHHEDKKAQYEKLAYRKEIKMKQLETNELRNLCIQMNWFTCGSVMQYNRLFELNKNGASVHELALIIWLCSQDSAQNTLELIETGILTAIQEKTQRFADGDIETAIGSLKYKFIVCMDSSYIRDSQMFDSKDLSDEEFADIDLLEEENENLWHDMSPNAFIGMVDAETEKEACRIAANQYGYDERCLYAAKVEVNYVR